MNLERSLHLPLPRCYEVYLHFRHPRPHCRPLWSLDVARQRTLYGKLGVGLTACILQSTGEHFIDCESGFLESLGHDEFRSHSLEQVL